MNLAHAVLKLVLNNIMVLILAEILMKPMLGLHKSTDINYNNFITSGFSVLAISGCSVWGNWTRPLMGNDTRVCINPQVICKCP